MLSGGHLLVTITYQGITIGYADRTGVGPDDVLTFLNNESEVTGLAFALFGQLLTFHHGSQPVSDVREVFSIGVFVPVGGQLPEGTFIIVFPFGRHFEKEGQGVEKINILGQRRLPSRRTELQGGLACFGIIILLQMILHLNSQKTGFVWAVFEVFHDLIVDGIDFFRILPLLDLGDQNLRDFCDLGSGGIRFHIFPAKPLRSSDELHSILIRRCGSQLSMGIGQKVEDHGPVIEVLEGVIDPLESQPGFPKASQLGKTPADPEKNDGIIVLFFCQLLDLSLGLGRIKPDLIHPRGSGRRIAGFGRDDGRITRRTPIVFGSDLGQGCQHLILFAKVLIGQQGLLRLLVLHQLVSEFQSREVDIIDQRTSPIGPLHPLQQVHSFFGIVFCVDFQQLQCLPHFTAGTDPRSQGGLDQRGRLIALLVFIITLRQFNVYVILEDGIATFKWFIPLDCIGPLLLGLEDAGEGEFCLKDALPFGISSDIFVENSLGFCVIRQIKVGGPQNKIKRLEEFWIGADFFGDEHQTGVICCGSGPVSFGERLRGQSVHLLRVSEVYFRSWCRDGRSRWRSWRSLSASKQCSRQKNNADRGQTKGKSRKQRFH